MTKDRVRVSPNKEIGVLPPGPINNNNLFIIVKSQDAQLNQSDISLTSPKVIKTRKLRGDLTLNEDYRGVNKDVWQLLNKIYGGGPIIVRKRLDIYSKDMITFYKTQVHIERRMLKQQVDKEEEIVV